MSGKKTAGIITMHRVMNYGSVLQAFALQQIVKKLGYDVQLIDYMYPNKFHLDKRGQKSLIYKITKTVYGFLRKCLFAIKYQGDKQTKIDNFCKKYFNLSSVRYDSPDAINNNPPDYDVYITGSDQVWNPTFTYADEAFMLSFAGDKRRIAYAPSVTQRNIPDEYKEIFITNLSKYSSLSVRDNYSAEDLSKLLGRKVETVCDPVLLLDSNDYSTIANGSKLKVDEKYILLYILDYMFDPYPEITSIISKIKQQYKIPVYFIWGNKNRVTECGADRYIPIPSVEDFLYLIKNASMVVTTSFHGTAFSLIFRKQFLAVTNDSAKDSRIGDLLNNVGMSSNCISYKSDFEVYNEVDYSVVGPQIDAYVAKSRDYLAESLK